MDNLIGKKLDGLYEVRELIGIGGMANVYKAISLGQNGPVPAGTVVAVKVLREEFVHDPDLVHRFKNESKAISLLNHPNIVKVYDVSVDDKLQYIVMEYVDGMNLRDYLNERGGKLSSRETVHFISQILQALDHAHKNGVVHRDVKPQNIMLLNNGQLRMMDFGIARISRAENQLLSGKAMGSVHYISPEQARGDVTDAKSDIYSVGVMMYEMLSGRLPFESGNAVEVAIKQISDTPRSLAEIAPTVPHALVEITERAMAKQPNDRYASAQEMLDALNLYIQDPEVSFAYKYLTEEAPAKVVGKTMNQKNTSRAAQAQTNAANTAKRKSKKKKKKHSVFLPVLFGITVAFVIGCAVLCNLILRNSNNPLFTDKAELTLPDYTGKYRSEVEASAEVTNNQLTITWAEEYNSNYEAGYVYKQSPAGGRTVLEGQNITLTVSLGTKYVTVPDASNYVQADAEQLLKDNNLSVLVVQSVDTSVAVGTVIRTEPAAGEVVAAGSTVVVYISRQQVTTTTTVPSLFGLSSVDDARTLLVQKHLTLGSQTEEYSDMPVGSIIAQSVDAGTTVKLNTRVSVTVSAGPEPTPEPTDEEFDWDDLTTWDTDRSEEQDTDSPSDGFGQFWKWFTGGA
jgi:serine/threonine-protein kinase